VFFGHKLDFEHQPAFLSLHKYNDRRLCTESRLTCYRATTWSQLQQNSRYRQHTSAPECNPRCVGYLLIFITEHKRLNRGFMRNLLHAGAAITVQILESLLLLQRFACNKLHTCTQV